MSIIATERLGHPSFGHVLVTVRCAKCGHREVGHLRRYRDGTLHLLVVGLPARSRRMLTRRKARIGWRVDYYTGTPWHDITEPQLSLHCRRHGARTVPRAAVAEALTSATPTRPKDIGA